MGILLPPGVFEGLRQELLLLGKTIEKVRYLRLKKELAEGVNPEINTDKQTLVSRMEELGFRKDIIEALRELDRKLYAAGKPLDFKASMDLARTKKAAAVVKLSYRLLAGRTLVPGNSFSWMHAFSLPMKANSFRSSTTICPTPASIVSGAPQNKLG